ncbi:Hypothetical protein CINCED_3A012170 [Cinara cedri]|uniref:Uncharacterized protein n=1 Tax=Cinara cedri TaxID=506608 RepID=A0A5E4N562_9HEMI|nr:Hypothetical protein CINCED_3A012170 [Cinara cedri]
MSVTTADCELLGRGPVQGTADSDSLAALVRQLCKQQQRGRLPGRRCAVACSRDAGLEIVPYQRKRPDDEGFESDEDLASLGSYEDPNKRKIGTLLAASAAGTGAGSDSANSSGVSEDSDDADAASLKEQDGVTAGPAVATAATDPPGGGGSDGRETYGLADVAFCHTDAAALPGIAVWVIKTRRASVAGLEAIVVRSRDNKLQDVCRAYQEHSRRLKLEPKLWASQANGAGASQRRKAGGGNVILTATPEVNRYNLVQRTDTDGVTHIEVTAGPVVATSADNACSSPDSRRAISRDGPPSSIISISTPESPRAKIRASGEDEDGGSVGDEPPPQRPERRKYKAKSEGGDSGGGDDFRRQQKVVRGQFIRVNVNHSAVLPPTSPPSDRKFTARREQPVVCKPTSGALSAASVPDRLWSTADYDRPDGRYEEHRRSSRSSSRTRSRSSGPSRRQLPLQLAPVVQPPASLSSVGASHPPPVAFSRYPNVVEQQQSSFGNRFFGKLREITSGNQSPPPQQDLQPVTFRRRNSVGESAAPNFYQYFSHNHHLHQQQYQQQLQYLQQHQHNRQQVKNGGNLKSVIKKNNKSQPYQHAYDEPKKVTFSAYATVQVVD